MGGGPLSPRGGSRHGQQHPPPWSSDPPPPGEDMQGALFTQRSADKKDVNVLPNTTHLDPPTDRQLKKYLGTLDKQEVPTYRGLLFFGGGGLEANLGLPWRTMDDVFNPPKPEVQRATLCAPTTPPSSPARRHASTPCPSMAGRGCYSAGRTRLSWPRPTGRTGMPLCTRRSVGSCRRNVLGAGGGC